MRESLIGMIAGLALGAATLAAGLWLGSAMDSGQADTGHAQTGERLPADPMPRLIGRGCHGAGGDIWAMEESDFPTQCKEIEVYQP